VAIGDVAFGACQALSKQAKQNEKDKKRLIRIACWQPDTESQVHRFTITHVLLHLGIDVFYFDFDIFFLRNPLPIVLQTARRDRLEALFASHGDGDCINIGLFYLRASSQSAKWFSVFLQHYHDYQYEIDQRVLDIFLGSPQRQPFSDLGISYPPSSFPPIRAGVLDDVNTVVIGFIGWAGHIGKMVAFHWCNLPLKRKWKEIAILYDAAETIEGIIPFDVAITAADTRGPPRQGFWPQLQEARRVLESYHVPLLERTSESKCW